MHWNPETYNQFKNLFREVSKAEPVLHKSSDCPYLI